MTIPRVTMYALLTLLKLSMAHAAPINHYLVFIETININTNLVKEQGSGIVLGRGGFIITIKHLFDDFDPTSDQIRVSLKAKQGLGPIEAIIVNCENNDVDLCLLHVGKEFLEQNNIRTSREVSCRFPVDQEVIAATGFVSGLSVPATTEGKIVSMDSGVRFKAYMNVVLAPGMSGGPVVDQDGKIIGIVSGAASGTGLTIFTPILFGRELLSQIGIECSAASGTGIQ